MDEATPEEERLKLISACNATIERLKSDYEKFKDDSEISDEIKEKVAFIDSDSAYLGKSEVSCLMDENQDTHHKYEF